jgi:hypothetical protein
MVSLPPHIFGVGIVSSSISKKKKKRGEVPGRMITSTLNNKRSLSAQREHVPNPSILFLSLKRKQEEKKTPRQEKRACRQNGTRWAARTLLRTLQSSEAQVSSPSRGDDMFRCLPTTRLHSRIAMIPPRPAASIHYTSAASQVFEYHENSKHHLNRYANAKGKYHTCPHEVFMYFLVFCVFFQITSLDVFYFELIQFS